MNNHWGYHRYDKDFKPAKTIIRKLVECVSKDGNLLLNVGPDAHGRIPQESIDILQEVGRWLERNGDSIYGCTSAPIDKPEYGRITRRGNKLYIHLMEELVGPIPVHGVEPARLEKARILATGAERPPLPAGSRPTIPIICFFIMGRINFSPIRCRMKTIRSSN